MSPLIEALRVLLTTAHLLANALAGGGLLVAGIAPLWSRRGGAADAQRRLAIASAWAMGIGLLTGGLGVSLVLVDGDPSYESAAARVPLGSYGMLAAEWAFTAALLAVYLAWWDRLRHVPILHSFIALVASTNFLYHFPTMMIVLGRLAEAPHAAAPVVTRDVFRDVISEPHLLAKTLHFWALSLLAAGVTLWWLARDRGVQAARVVALAGALAMFATGVPLLATTPSVTARLLGGFGNPAGWAFWCGVIAAIASLAFVARAACGAGGRPARAAALVTAAALLMTAAVTTARHATNPGAAIDIRATETNQ